MATLPDPTGSLDAEGQRIFQKLAGPRGGLSGMYLALMNHPALAEHVGILGSYLRFGGELPDPMRETAILAAARMMGSGYEWEKHVGPAEKAGVTAAAIEALRREQFASEALSPQQQRLCELVRRLLSDQDIPRGLQDGISRELGLRGLIELVVLVGFYRMINTVIVSFDVDLPEEGPPPF